jgi:carboxyl-terminal processing protease
MTLDKKTRGKILRALKKLVLAHHINVAGIDYGAWTKRVDDQTAGLLEIDVSGFEESVREFLSELKTSHTVLYHSVPQEFLPQYTINATVRKVAKDGDHKWMFLDVFDGGPADAAGIKTGDILEAIDGSPCVPPAMPSFAIGQTHKLLVGRPTMSSAREIVIEVPGRKGTKQRPPLIEPKSPIHSMVGQDIGLLKIPYFAGALGMRFTRALDSAMDDLKKHGCKRLIIDLRGNIGGSLGFARLASYLCPGQNPIGYSLTPKRLRDGYDPATLPKEPMPQARLELLLTLARYAFRDKSLMLLTQGLGPQPFHGKIAMLVNEWTNSAGEMVANFAAENRLATLIGQKTRGNVLGAMNFKVGGGYWLRLPVMGWFTPHGRSLEGNGVNPDIAVEVVDGCLLHGQEVQMARAIQIVNGF